MKRGNLILADGTRFEGMQPVDQTGSFSGEVVFTTGMTGYPETLTDPSYAGQLIVFTYPLLGNYGVPAQEKWESTRIWARGVIAGRLCETPSHRESESSLAGWLKAQRVGWLSDVDTRALTKWLRARGTLGGTIGEAYQEPPSLEKVVSEVSLASSKIHPSPTGKGNKRLIAVDCGMKENILRLLLKQGEKRGVEVVRVPWDYDYSHEPFDGLFLSNGPGDPVDCEPTIRVLKTALLLQKPIFGICLGAQLLALASGAKTYKLPFGHRGQNQPVRECRSQKCFITSQNHGYAIVRESLSSEWEVSWENLNDGSVEGIGHKSLPYQAVQFHPEASPGPHDTGWLFEEFIGRL